MPCIASAWSKRLRLVFFADVAARFHHALHGHGHLLPTVVGLTHASSVSPLESCSEAELGIVTSALVPLNDSASPYLPEGDHVAFEIVPLLVFPDRSVTVVPEPSSNA